MSCKIVLMTSPGSGTGRQSVINDASVTLSIFARRIKVFLNNLFITNKNLIVHHITYHQSCSINIFFLRLNLQTEPKQCDKTSALVTTYWLKYERENANTALFRNYTSLVASAS